MPSGEEIWSVQYRQRTARDIARELTAQQDRQAVDQLGTIYSAAGWQEQGAGAGCADN